MFVRKPSKLCNHNTWKNIHRKTQDFLTKKKKRYFQQINDKFARVTSSRHTKIYLLEMSKAELQPSQPYTYVLLFSDRFCTSQIMKRAEPQWRRKNIWTTKSNEIHQPTRHRITCSRRCAFDGVLGIYDIILNFPRMALWKALSLSVQNFHFSRFCTFPFCFVSLPCFRGSVWQTEYDYTPNEGRIRQNTDTHGGGFSSQYENAKK